MAAGTSPSLHTIIMTSHATIFNLLFLLLLLCGCTDNEQRQDARNWQVQGKVEKGPFVRGSNVTIQELNESLVPTGKSFQTTIIDNEGYFSLDNISLETPYVQLIATGYYFNEVEGELSEGQITLQALADLTNSTSININILTHLQKDRLVQLIKEEQLSFKEASAKAEAELLTCFGLQKYAGKILSNYSIATGTDESGMLIVVSSSLLKDKSEAEFTEFIAGLCSDFKSTGKFSDENSRQIQKSSTELDLSAVANNVQERYKSIGKEVTVPDLRYYIDWNGDGIAGNEVGSGTDKNLSFETDTLKVGQAGGKFRVKINGHLPCRFSTTETPIPPISTERFDCGVREATFTKSISSDKYLELDIEPSKGILMKPATVTVYSYDGRYSASLQIVQEENPDGELVSESVQELYSSVLQSMQSSFCQNYLMEGVYSGCFTLSTTTWDAFSNHHLESFNNTIYNAWTSTYKTLARIRMVKERYEEEKVYLGVSAFCNLEAMVYYQLAVIWGNVPYIKKTPSMEDVSRIPQVNEKELFAQLEVPLRNSIEKMAAKKNNNQIFVSKDVPRLILARMYMQIGDYTKASPLLKEIISNGDYTVSASWDKMFSASNSDAIFSLLQSDNNEFGQLIIKSDQLPVLTYTETLLLAAECELRTGNKSSALSYLNTVRTKRGKQQVDSAKLEAALVSTWQEELKGCFSYFAFLKRNGLAENCLSIQPFQKIFPIPQSELDRNPGIKQNPGY